MTFFIDDFISATVAESFALKYLLWLCSIFMLSNPNQIILSQTRHIAQ